jgi:ABC-type antimicrobial peptide transport system permease subunit
MFITEALIISALGGAVGVGLGSIGSLIMESHGIDLGGLASKMPNTLPVNRIIHGDWEPRIALLAFLLGLAMALVGAVSPALRATRIAPVTAMRARR